MSARLPPCVSIDLGTSELQDVINKAKDFALMHGIFLLKVANSIVLILWFQVLACDPEQTSVQIP